MNRCSLFFMIFLITLHIGIVLRKSPQLMEIRLEKQDNYLRIVLT
nr:MAG TPA: hypothetical protein [Caudoviricetes sp.]